VEIPGEPALDDETQKFITQSLTDVDLFASYGLTQKAIGLLEAILRRAPRHTPTLEKLLDFVLGAGDDRRTAELAAQLERIHTETGDQRSAERFGELRRRFQRAAGLSDEDLALAAPGAAASAEAAAEEIPEVAIPEIAAEPAAPPVPKAAPLPPEPEPEPIEVSAAPEIAAVPEEAQEEVQEVDLSAEWETLIDESKGAEEVAEAPAKAPAKPAAPPKPKEEPAPVEEFHIEEEPVLSSETPAPAEPAIAMDSQATEIPLVLPPVEEPAKPAPKEKEKEKAKEKAPSPPPAAKEPPKAPKAPEPEFELEQEYELVLDAEPLVPAYDQKPPETPLAPPPPEPVAQNSKASPPAGSGLASDQFLADLAKEIDGLGLDELAPGFSGTASQAQQPVAAKPAAPAVSPTESGPLKEVFDEFRAELGEMGAEDEDLETHYNLGIAFREMGLLEEAISEFQKVAKASDRGRAFRYTMQCCTLLGLAFMEKGQPAIAAIWYQRALETPGMDPESTLALRYDLGVAQESAGEPDAALKSFSQVYAMNIDYRDVAERIAALQKPIR